MLVRTGLGWGVGLIGVVACGHISETAPGRASERTTTAADPGAVAADPPSDSDVPTSTGEPESAPVVSHQPDASGVEPAPEPIPTDAGVLGSGQGPTCESNGVTYPCNESPPSCVPELPPAMSGPGSGQAADGRKLCGVERDNCGTVYDFGVCYGTDLCGGEGTYDADNSISVEKNICASCRPSEDPVVMAACDGQAFVGCNWTLLGCEYMSMSGSDAILRSYSCCPNP